MRLDISSLRYLSAVDWRVLTAVETGSRNFEFVPLANIANLAGHRSGSAGDVQRSISTLAKIGLIDRGGSKGKGKAGGDGYRLTYGGLDYLALHSLEKMSPLSGVGSRIGVGKESDIFDVILSHEDGMSSRAILKIHRLGRVSFKKGVRRRRDYGKGPRQPGSWMWMSRLAAAKEFAFMKALGGVDGIRVPEAIAHSRHMVLMEFIDGAVLRGVQEVGPSNSRVGALYSELMGTILKLATLGLIHGDFNEFNLILEERPSAQSTESNGHDLDILPVVIDFPQMVSVDHTNADFYFRRDVDCIKTFFERRFKFVSDDGGPVWTGAKNIVGQTGSRRLDVEVEASGFSRKMAKELEAYMKEHGIDGDNHDEQSDGIDDDDDEGAGEEQEEAGRGDCFDRDIDEAIQDDAQDQSI